MNAVTLWRLSPGYHVPQAMTGEGAFRRGGRWNPPGIRVVYCADSRSLAVLEVLANLKQLSSLNEQAWGLLPVEVPSEVVERPARVPDSWRDMPYSTATQSFGAEWVQAQRSAALRVPSVVVPGEFNYLLNPAHRDFKRVQIGRAEPFAFDTRIMA